MRSLKQMFARHVTKEAPSAWNSHVPGHPIPPPQHQPEISTPDAIIGLFEPLLVHAPRNTKILTTLAEAYGRKMLFDQSLSLYRRVLEVRGGKDPTIEEAIADTTLKKLDLQLSQLDSNAPDHIAQRERLQNQRLEYQRHKMEESH
jgi:hypothetical protein